MPFRDETYGLRVRFLARHYELSAEEKGIMEEDLRTLRGLVSSFPTAGLVVEVLRHPRTHDFHVKTSLHLPMRTLFTGDRAALPHPAYERCIRKLVNKVRAYKERMSGKREQERVSQGYRSEVWPSQEPDLAELERAAMAGDYAAFRRSIAVYDDALRHRIGRWIQRYPRAEAMLGEDLLLDEVLEEVYLNALEGFAARPAGRLGNWLEWLIDYSIRILVRRGEEEIAELRMAEEVSPQTPGPPLEP